jgi:hypothetical protein
MWQFLQTYGIWLLFGLFFLLMLRMHGGGMHGHRGGHGMGTGYTQDEGSSNMQRAVPSYHQHEAPQRVVPLDNAERDTVVRDITPGEENTLAEQPRPKRRSGC